MLMRIQKHQKFHVEQIGVL